MSYQTDSIEIVYDEIQKLEAEIMSASGELKSLGENESRAAAEYENKKNGYLIELFAEEVDKASKRTEAHRTAMYRKMFEMERLKKILAAHELKSQQDYIKSLLAVLNAKQSRLRILEGERISNGRNQP